MTQTHYFKPNQALDHEIKTIEYTIAQHNFQFITDRGVFSRNKVDYGTNIMLKTVITELKKSRFDFSYVAAQDESQNNMIESINGIKIQKCLDLGCGYGVVSIVLNTLFPEQRWYAVDINPRAVELTKRNSKKHGLNITVIESDGIPKSIISSSEIYKVSEFKMRTIESDGIPESMILGSESDKKIKFDLVILNPPIRAGKDVCYRLFTEVAAAIKTDSVFYTVIQKKQGAVSAFKYLQKLFSDVIVVDKSGGYHTIRCRIPSPIESD